MGSDRVLGDPPAIAAHRYGIGGTRLLLDTPDAGTSRDLRPVYVRFFPSLY
jgi:hypothetical protein